MTIQLDQCSGSRVMERLGYAGEHKYQKHI